MSVALADVAASASPRARARRGVAFGRFCRHRTAARAFCKKGRGCLSPQGLTLAPDAGSRIVSADVARCLTEPCSDCGGYYHVRGDDKKDATKSATWVCGTCRFRKVINYHNGGLRREVTVELVTQLNEMLKCKDGVDRTKLHRLVQRSFDWDGLRGGRILRGLRLGRQHLRELLYRACLRLVGRDAQQTGCVAKKF
jgi:hypothetical protein